MFLLSSRLRGSVPVVACFFYFESYFSSKNLCFNNLTEKGNSAKNSVNDANSHAWLDPSKSLSEFDEWLINKEVTAV